MSQNLQKTLAALVGPAQSLENALWQLLTERAIDTAIGVQLDVIGLIVKQPRDGLVDADYRRSLRVRIATNRSRGIVENLITVVNLYIADDAATIVVDQLGVAAVHVRIEDSSLSSTLADALFKFLRDAASAGVRIILETSGDAEAEMFYTAVFASLDGAHGSGATTLTVLSVSPKFPFSGSLILDEGLAVEETVTYTGKTATTFTGVSTTANAHTDKAAVVLVGSLGKGLGDTVTAVGGKLAKAAG